MEVRLYDCLNGLNRTNDVYVSMGHEFPYMIDELFDVSRLSGG